ncbi:M3 family oligoendopeptidase [Fusibacter bizertensis]
MSAQWNLDDLYTSFNSTAFLTDVKKCESLKRRYSDLVISLLSSHIDEVASIEGFLKTYIEDITLLRKLSTFGHLTFATNSKSQEALSLKAKVEQFISELTSPMVAFKLWLKEVNDLTPLADQSSFIKEHYFYLMELIKSTEHMLSSEEEILISKLVATGSSAWETLQSKASSQLSYEVKLPEGTRNMPIMAIRNLAFSPDVEIRKIGYFSELSAYEKHAEISAAALNGIKGEVLTLSAMRGFEAPLDETLYNSRMSREILDAMINSMESYLDEFRRYLKLKSKLLGNEGALPFYDLFAPVSDTDRNYTIGEAHEFIVKYFGDFSPELSQFADHCFTSNWIDFEPKEGKVGGAFCSNIPSIKQSRVLLNFTGKLKNVLTIAHELGHAFHGDRIMSESILNTSYPMPLAETASIFCETIVRNAVLKDADDDLRLSILENSLQSATQVVVDILSRYYFEASVFEARKDHPLSVNELKELMLTAQKKSYGDGLDENFLHPYMWLNKTHYYATRNFYNFPYAFGLLFATGLYAKYLEDKAIFVSKYDTMLKATGKMNIQEVCALMDIDPSSQLFWDASLKKIKEDVDAFEEIVQKKCR